MCRKNLQINKIITLFFLLIMCTGFFGCDKQEISIESEDFVTFTDALNRKVTVRKNPQRVAALIGGFADIWVLSGGSVCAAPVEAEKDYGIRLDNCVNLGGAHSPSAESLLSSDPDLVLASASTSSNVALKETLESAGVTVAYFDVDSFDDYLKMLEITTRITGRYDLYEKNGKELQKKIENIRKEYKETSVPDKMKKVMLLRASQGFVKTKGSDGTVLGEMLKDLGCINIADSESALAETLNAESIIKEDPYRIFVVVMGSDSEKAMENLYRLIKENPALSELDAVKKNRIHIMEKELYHTKPNAKWAVSYENLKSILLDTKE